MSVVIGPGFLPGAEHPHRQAGRHEVAVVFELDVGGINVLVELAIVDTEEMDKVRALASVTEP